MRNNENECKKAGPEIEVKECVNERKTCWKERTDLIEKKLKTCPLSQKDRKRRSGETSDKQMLFQFSGARYSLDATAPGNLSYLL